VIHVDSERVSLLTRPWRHPDNERHRRAGVGVTALAPDALVEIDLIARLS
jgi:enamine deaminase RidA (YjgF/YER057c/UK114 family)